MRLTALLLLVLALAAGRAEAQPAPWAPERLTPGWVFLPSFVFGALWDSNVTVQGQGSPEVEEWVGVLNPRGELVYNGRLTRFNAGYSGALERYRELRSLDRFEQRARAQFRHQATQRVHFTATGSVAQTPTTDRLEVQGLPFIDIGSRSTDINGNAVFDLTRRTSIDAGYHFQRIDFDREQTATLPAYLTGGYAHTPSIALRHQVTSRFGTGASYEFQRATVGGGASSFDAQNAMGDVRYRLGENTVASGSAGVSYLYIADTGVDRWGPSLRGTLEHHAGLTQITLRYERAFIPTFSFGGTTGNQFLSLSATTPLTRGGRLTAAGSVSYGRTEPLEELGNVIRRDSYWFNGSLGYQLARWLRTDGFVTSSHQRSSAQGNVNRLRVGIQFSTSKPLRIQ